MTDEGQLETCIWRTRGLGCGDNPAAWCGDCPKRQGAASAQSIAEKRAAFEAWVLKTHGRHALSDPDTGSMWSAWQASAAADEALMRQALAALEASRDDVVEVLNNLQHGKGYARYDRAIEQYTEQIARHDAAIVALTERLKGTSTSESFTSGS